ASSRPPRSSFASLTRRRPPRSGWAPSSFRALFVVVPVAVATILAQLPSLVDELLLLLLVLLDLAGVARGQLNALLRLDAALQLTSPLEFGVELGAEEKRHVD